LGARAVSGASEVVCFPVMREKKSRNGATVGMGFSMRGK
jgi:hypothetical protein